jgi:hypothetical protein
MSGVAAFPERPGVASARHTRDVAGNRERRLTDFAATTPG